MRLKASIMDEAQIRRTLIRMSHEIIEKNRGVDNLVLVGLQRRGYYLAEQIAEIIKTVENKDIPVGSLDVSKFKDKTMQKSAHPHIKSKNSKFSLANADIILVDDVLYTGRTVRTAIEAIGIEGSPRTVQLAVLIDRGNRELPIGANYIGKNLPTSHNELVSVSVKDVDGVCRVEIYNIE